MRESMRLLLYCHCNILLPRSPCLQRPRITVSLVYNGLMKEKTLMGSKVLPWRGWAGARRAANAEMRIPRQMGAAKQRDDYERNVIELSIFVLDDWKATLSKCVQY